MSSESRKLIEECISGYEWPASMVGESPSQSLGENFRTSLAALLVRMDRKIPLIVTFVSAEYLLIFEIWESYCAKWSANYIVICFDPESRIALQDRGTPHIYTSIDATPDADFVSKQGFDEKGLRIIGLKFQVLRHVVQMGFDAIFSDVDAILLRNPYPYFRENAFFCGQRIAYFPKRLTEVWGFAICSGFFYMRSCASSLSLLDRSIEMQRLVASDQIALNLALYDLGVEWESVEGMNHRDNDRNVKERFAENSNSDIFGELPSLSGGVVALRPDLFWRNDLVQLQVNDCVILHPNSPKAPAEKRAIFFNLGIINDDIESE